MKEMNTQKAEFPAVFKPQTPSGAPKTVDTRGPKKEMRGPSIDPSLFGSVNNYPMPPGPIDFSNDYEDDRFSVASSDSSMSVESIKRLNFPPQNNQGVVKKRFGKSKGLELNIT